MVKKNICEISIIIIIILICQKLGSVVRIKQNNKLPSALALFLPVFVKFRPNQRYTHLFVHSTHTSKSKMRSFKNKASDM